MDESFIHFACEGTGYAYRSVADEVRPVPEPDGRQEHVQGLRRGGHPGRLRRDGARSGADAARTTATCGTRRAWPSTSSTCTPGRTSRSNTSASASGSSATRGDSSPRWPRSTVCTSTRPSPTSPWWSSENGLSAEDLVCRLLVRRGIYTRTCDDKKGLEPGKFVRIAARNRPENAYIIRSLRRLIG